MSDELNKSESRTSSYSAAELEAEIARLRIEQANLQANLRAEEDRLRIEKLTADSALLREVLRRVRIIAGDALADVTPYHTIFVVKERSRGEIIACCPVSDVVADDGDRVRSIVEFGHKLDVSVDFVKVRHKILTSVAGCKAFLRILDCGEEVPEEFEKDFEEE